MPIMPFTMESTLFHKRLTGRPQCARAAHHGLVAVKPVQTPITLVRLLGRPPPFELLDKFVVIIALPIKCLHCGGSWSEYST